MCDAQNAAGNRSKAGLKAMWEALVRREEFHALICEREDRKIVGRTEMAEWQR